jgi:hypothetical protein
MSYVQQVARRIQEVVRANGGTPAEDDVLYVFYALLALLSARR